MCGGIIVILESDFCPSHAGGSQATPAASGSLGLDPGTLELRKDGVRHGFRTDWTDGARIIVAPAELKAQSRAFKETPNSDARSSVSNCYGKNIEHTS